LGGISIDEDGEEYDNPDEYSKEEETQGFGWINLIGVVGLIFGVPAIF
jgi:hypothetical protein